jgi:hypothetical protein
MIMSAEFLSALDPTLLGSARDRLANAFADNIAARAPEVSEMLAFQAERARDRATQSALQRASDQLLSGRGVLQTQIARLTSKRFDARVNPMLDRLSQSSRIAIDKLSLVGHEQLDEEIAVNQSGRRLKEQCEYELWTLTQQLCILLGKDKLSDQENPVMPRLLAEVLMDSLDVLDAHPGASLPLFNAFGPPMLDIVPEVYKSTADFLSARGIHVETDSYYGPPVISSHRAFVTVATPQQIALDSARRDLLATLQGAGPNAIRHDILPGPNPAVSGKVPAQTTATSINQSIWQDSLRRMEQALLDQPDNKPPRTLHDARRSLADHLDSDEKAVADIVTVMFDRLSTDSRLPAALRKIIGRLQLPVLETALVDRNVLSYENHPVRRLIDLMAEFAISLNLDAEDDSALQSIDSVVDGLVRIHATQADAFEQAYKRLDDLFYHREEAALLSDPAGRAIEATEASERARRRAEREIALRLQGWTLPASITHFINMVWRDALVEGYLSPVSAGDFLHLDLETLDSLLRGLDARTPRQERRRLMSIIPALIKSARLPPPIHAGSNAIRDAFFQELQQAQERIEAGDFRALAGARVILDSTVLDESDSPASPSEQLTRLGLACGDWLESHDAGNRHLWRINWITSVSGTCILKDYETRAVRTMPVGELAAQIDSGRMRQTHGLGITGEAITSGFNAVNRRQRRQPGNSRRPATINDFRQESSP